MAFVQTRLRNTAHQKHSSSNRPQLRLTPAAAALCMLFVALHAPAAESTLWPQQGGSEANPLVLDGTSYLVESNAQGGWYRLENDVAFTGQFNVDSAKVMAVDAAGDVRLAPSPSHSGIISVVRGSQFALSAKGSIEATDSYPFLQGQQRPADFGKKLFVQHNLRCRLICRQRPREPARHVRNHHYCADSLCFFFGLRHQCLSSKHRSNQHAGMLFHARHLYE